MEKVFRGLLICFLITGFSVISFAQMNREISSSHKFKSVSSDSGTTGFILPSAGTINALIIFAQFPDDDFQTGSSLWPKGKAPADMDKWVNQTWTNNPIQGSLTHYFNDMSFDKFKFTGRAVSVIAPHTRQWYLNRHLTRGDIHKEIILKIDSTMDFAEFDNWTCTYDLHHLNRPDGIVDLIIFIWRNISKDLPDEQDISDSLHFSNDCGSIGGSDFTVDNGLRIIRTGNLTSGTTIRNYLPDRNQAFRIVVHEIAHFIMGGNNYHNGFGFWGMLSSYGIRSIVANTFERTRLGWIKPRYISADSAGTIRNIKLSDYATTGEALCLEIDPAHGQYFYIENHQDISFWETKFTFGDIAKGLYLIRQDKTTPSLNDGTPNSSYLQLISAEGRFDWKVSRQVKNPWGNSPSTLPVFRKVQPDRTGGYTPLDYIPYTLKNASQSVSPIYFTENANNNAVQDVAYEGSSKDPFNIGYNQVFTPWSNPDSYNFYRNPTVFGFKIDSLERGIFSLDVFVHTSVDAPPSKPIGLTADVDSVSHSAKLTWQPNLEPDLSLYEVSRSEGNLWKVIGTTKDTVFTDDSLSSYGKLNVGYRIRAKDLQNLYSVYSDVSSIILMPNQKIAGTDGKPAAIEYKLYQNYPNPFNPLTTIKYSIPEASSVTLKVYDILGREITTLVNEKQPAGNYSIKFNGYRLSSGVYFYKIVAVPESGQAGNFISTKKFIVLK